jgi:hypothetical protein
VGGGGGGFALAQGLAGLTLGPALIPTKAPLNGGNHDIVIETRGLNIGDSSMRGQNSDGFFLWKNN